jgi:hypothetical protein
MSLTTAPAQILARSQAAALCGESPGGSVTVVNLDLTQTVYVGYQPGLSAGASDAISVPPLGAAVIDTSAQSYIVSGVAAGISCQLIPGAAQWTPSPAQVALQIQALGLATETTQMLNHTAINTVNGTLGAPAQDGTVTGLATSIPVNISTTGVPLLTGAAQVASGSGTIAVGATLSPAAFTIGQIGYEVIMTFQIAAGATIPFLQVILTWTDITSGLTVGVEEWWLSASSGSAQQFIGRGPSKGNKLAITIKNFDPADTVTYSYSVLANSRIYLRDEWRQTTTALTPGFTNPATDPNAGLLAGVNASISSGITLTRILPLYSGLVNVNCYTQGGQPGTFEITSQSQNASMNPYQRTVAATSAFPDSVALPRTVCSLSITNTGNASANYQCNIIAQELTV